MKIKLPQELIGTVFQKLFPVEMNTFSVEMLLPSLFFLIESKGRQRRKKADSEIIDEYLSDFQDHKRLQGFSDINGKRLLEKWVKTSLMVIGKKGKKRVENQILYLQPLTYLTFKAGFPSTLSRLRNVHYFIYRLMIDALKEQGEQKAYLIVRSALRQAFAEGINNLPEGDAPGIEIDGVYDGQTKLDTETLLATLFMDIFSPSQTGLPLKSEAQAPVCEGQAKRFMQGFIKFIKVFKDRMPARELIYNLQTLINFELCIYTLKLIYGTNYLVKTGDIPAQFTLDILPTKPEIYVDVTDNQKCFSREIARQCVSRDLQEFAQFFTSNLKLRSMDYFANNCPVLKNMLAGNQGREYFRVLNSLTDDNDIQADARSAINRIRNKNKKETDETDEMLEEFFSRCDNLYPDDSLSRLVMILDEAQRNSRGGKMIQWFKDVGGVEKNYGFIKGSSKHRNTWAYSMSNDLLWALIHLASINPSETGHDNFRPKRIRLAEFLEFLEKWYGIIINRVPEGMESISNHRSARENLSALQKRLKQMGLFDNLSDDFEAQYIKPQYREVLKPKILKRLGISLEQYIRPQYREVLKAGQCHRNNWG